MWRETFPITLVRFVNVSLSNKSELPYCKIKSDFVTSNLLRLCKSLCKIRIILCLHSSSHFPTDGTLVYAICCKIFIYHTYAARSGHESQWLFIIIHMLPVCGTNKTMHLRAMIIFVSRNYKTSSEKYFKASDKKNFPSIPSGIYVAFFLHKHC